MAAPAAETNLKGSIACVTGGDAQNDMQKISPPPKPHQGQDHI